MSAPQHHLEGVWRSRERVSGVPCFAGTRIPVRTMLLYLAEGEPLDAFLRQYEGVTKEQAQLVLAGITELLDDVIAFDDEGREP